MEFKAREGYKKEAVADEYDSHRFVSLKGRVTDWLEKSCIERAFNKAGLKSGKVLDIPCGTARLSLLLAEKGFEVTGADISEAMIKISRRKAADSGKNISFQAEDAERLTFKDNCFDVVASLRLFGHVPPNIRANMLKEFKRVSKGYLVLAYYHSASIQFIKRKKTRAAKGIPWYPVTYAQARAEIQAAGLELVKIFPMMPGISETIIVLAKRADKKVPVR